MAYDTLASEDTITRTLEALAARHFKPEHAATGEVALARIRELIPAGASLMNGASRTLEQIGFVDLLKEKTHDWNNLHDAIIEETDEARRAELRAHAVVSDWYLGSAHAITEDGQIHIASNSGSQLPHLAFTSPNIVLVVGTHKIVKDLAEAGQRLNERIIPLEDERMKEVYGYGTAHMKTLILHGENPAIGRNVHLILVDEVLGF